MNLLLDTTLKNVQCLVKSLNLFNDIESLLTQKMDKLIDILQKKTWETIDVFEKLNRDEQLVCNYIITYKNESLFDYDESKIDFIEFKRQLTKFINFLQIKRKFKNILVLPIENNLKLVKYCRKMDIVKNDYWKYIFISNTFRHSYAHVVSNLCLDSVDWITNLTNSGMMDSSAIIFHIRNFNRIDKIKNILILPSVLTNLVNEYVDSKIYYMDMGTSTHQFDSFATTLTKAIEIIMLKSMKCQCIFPWLEENIQNLSLVLID